MSAGKCLKGDTVVDWYEKVAAVHVGSVICPDGAHECPDLQTCCMLSTGEWGCCPLPRVCFEFTSLLPFFSYQMIVINNNLQSVVLANLYLFFQIFPFQFKIQ